MSKIDKHLVPPLGEQLRSARQAASLSLAQTVKLIRRRRPLASVLWELEKGRGKVSVLRKVAAALGRSLALPSIKTMRELRGLTRQELCRLANVHATTLRKMESDPTDALVDRAERVYAALGQPLRLTA